MLMSEGCVELVLLLIWVSVESWPWEHGYRRTDPASSQLQYSGRVASHIMGVSDELALRVRARTLLVISPSVL